MKKNLAKAAHQIDESVIAALECYFHAMDGEIPNNLYEMIVGRAERALITTVIERAQGNQCKAAQMLGVSRTTLRNRLSDYKLM
ncbi:MAG: Fis family transcriptional regulator [Proteobacteria bacterium]|nr:Fis family transcriptional regulator [Pseudomonadota bacterium]MCL2308070.1 Fis family transcriptional regulator [Pseudomonadota bacterium]